MVMHTALVTIKAGALLMAGNSHSDSLQLQSEVLERPRTRSSHNIASFSLSPNII